MYADYNSEEEKRLEKERTEGELILADLKTQRMKAELSGASKEELDELDNRIVRCIEGLSNIYLKLWHMMPSEDYDIHRW